MVLSFPRHLRKSFTTAAKHAYPSETFAYCLGKETSRGTWEISQLLYPRIIQSRTHTGFSIPLSSSAEALELAASTDTRVIASLHSHPYTCTDAIYGAAPSEIDWKYFDSELFMGICQVSSTLRARYKFWPRLPVLTLVT